MTKTIEKVRLKDREYEVLVPADITLRELLDHLPSYRILREVKPDPMPEILPGDYLHLINGDSVYVRRVQQHCIFDESEKVFRRCEKEHVERIYRKGNLIWERSK